MGKGSILWVSSTQFQQIGVHLILKASKDVPVVDSTPSIPTIRMGNGDMVPVFDIPPKQIYQLFWRSKNKYLPLLNRN